MTRVSGCLQMARSDSGEPIYGIDTMVSHRWRWQLKWNTARDREGIGWLANESTGSTRDWLEG